MNSAGKLLLVMAVLLAGCAPTGTTRYETDSSSRVQAPASQGVAKSESQKRAKAHTDLGFEYYAQNQLGTALLEAKVALKDDSSFTPAYNLMALVSMALRDYKSADEAFHRALQLSPGDPEIANNYGWFLCQTKREREAFPYFDSALRNPLYPTPGIALTNSADCATQIGDYKSAEASLTRALALNPDNIRALMSMAKLKYLQKQYPDARFYVGEVHRIAEPSAFSASLALRIARQTGNREDEARYLSLLRKKFPDSEEYKKLTQGAVE